MDKVLAILELVPGEETNINQQKAKHHRIPGKDQCYKRNPSQVKGEADGTCVYDLSCCGKLIINPNLVDYGCVPGDLG